MDQTMTTISLFHHNMEKYITYSIPVEKKLKNPDKYDKDITITISCELNLINSAKFIETSLLNSFR